MSLKSGIFDSTKVETTETGLLRGDKAVDALYLTSLLTALVKNGVFANVGDGFKTTAAGGTAGESDAMQVITGSGACIINGHFAYDAANEIRSFTVTSEKRTVVRMFRLDMENKTLLPIWKECVRLGKTYITKAENQFLPVRTDTIYDIVTAAVEIPAGAAAITDSMVTDLRGDEKYCGFACAAI